jgi:glutamate-1-semialdehyde 2,1-aminomutase
MRAALTEVMTPAAYAHMLDLARQLAEGLRNIIGRRGLPWCVTQVGARVEFQFCPVPPRNGTEADRILDAELEQLIHLGLLNRGVLITPFHNMLLVCPSTTHAHVAQLLGSFDEVLGSITVRR